MDAALVKALADQAAEYEDQTEVTSNDFPDRRIPPAGRSVARFIEYIELGAQEQKPWQGKPRNPSDMVRLVFELLSGHNLQDITVEGVQKKIADRVSLTVKKSLAAKGNYRKLFDKMRYGRDSIKHMAQMLGHPFLIDIVHNEKKDDQGKVIQTYANMYTKESGWLITGPFITDPLTNQTTDLSSKVPEAISPLRIFLWEQATKETWDSLFIDGMADVKDAAGNVVGQKSKNWLQEWVLKATNFAGSPLEALLGGLPSLNLPETTPSGDPLAAALVSGTATPSGAAPQTPPLAAASVSAGPSASSQPTSIQLPPGLTLEQYQAFLALQAGQSFGVAAANPAGTSSEPAVAAASPTPSSEPKKGRGRPSGSKNKANAAPAVTPSTPAPASATPATSAPTAEAALAALGL